MRRRRPTPGERNRGAVDALQTKIAVNIQNLDSATYQRQLEANIKELPDATGCDAARPTLTSTSHAPTGPSSTTGSIEAISTTSSL